MKLKLNGTCQPKKRKESLDLLHVLYESSIYDLTYCRASAGTY